MLWWPRSRRELDQAKLNLEWTRIYSPANGYVTNVQLREGSYIHVGTPVITCIDGENWWVVANFRENAMAELRSGQPARVAFRSAPEGSLRATLFPSAGASVRAKVCLPASYPT